MAGRLTNRMEIKRREDGSITIEFVDSTPYEHAAQPETRAAIPEGLDLQLSEESMKDPILSMMASETAIHGVSKRLGHIWGG